MKNEFVIITISLTILAAILNGCIKESPYTEGDSIKTITYYVGGNGSENYSRIQDAIDKAYDNDSIFVYKGVYPGNIVINKTLKIVGENRETTIINGRSFLSTMIIRANNITVSGFTIITNSSLNYIRNENVFLNFSDSPPLNIFAGIEVDWSNNITISGNIIKNNNYGIWLRGCINNIIIDNIITKNKEYGVVDDYGDCNNVINNIIYNNRGGIKLISSKRGKIINNDLYNNDFFAIKLEGNQFSYKKESNNNSISKNHIINNENFGLIMYWSYYNIISENTIINNLIGIFLENNSNNNFLYNNNFINNTRNAQDNSNNTWYNSSLEFGNYWSDFTDKYPNANYTNSIWEIPYIINGGDNYDRFPLVNPIKM